MRALWGVLMRGWRGGVTERGKKEDEGAEEEEEGGKQSIAGEGEGRAEEG